MRESGVNGHDSASSTAPFAPFTSITLLIDTSGGSGGSERPAPERATAAVSSMGRA